MLTFMKKNISNYPDILPGFEHINRYWNRSKNMYVAQIKVGEFYVTKKNEAITTLLGSCVAVCIREKVLKMGGMNHFMLPIASNGNEMSIRTALYGDFAMESLMNEILKYGGKRENFEVKVFGGAYVLSMPSNIGEDNVKFVINYLHEENLNIISQDVGDIYPRNVVYYPYTGVAMVRKLISEPTYNVISEERKYLKSLKKNSGTEKIDIFKKHNT